MMAESKTEEVDDLLSDAGQDESQYALGTGAIESAALCLARLDFRVVSATLCALFVVVLITLVGVWTHLSLANEDLERNYATVHKSWRLDAAEFERCQELLDDQKLTAGKCEKTTAKLHEDIEGLRARLEGVERALELCKKSAASNSGNHHHNNNNKNNKNKNKGKGRNKSNHGKGHGKRAASEQRRRDSPTQ